MKLSVNQIQVTVSGIGREREEKHVGELQITEVSSLSSETTGNIK